MPIYEYECRACGHHFEALVLPWLGTDSKGLACPSCDGHDVERIVSMFAVSSEATRQLHLADGRKHARKEHIEKKREEHKMIHEHRH